MSGKFCTKCGTVLVDGVCPKCSQAQQAGFCTKCGTALVNGACPKCSQARQNSHTDKFKHFFMNPKEQFVCALGNGYIQNFLANGYVGNGFAVVSDKRVYFNGKTYEVHNSRLKATSESRTVDLKDVTGTGVRAIVYPLLKIFAIISAVAMVLIAIGAGITYYTSNDNTSNVETTDIATIIFIYIPIVMTVVSSLICHLTRKKGLKTVSEIFRWLKYISTGTFSGVFLLFLVAIVGRAFLEESPVVSYLIIFTFIAAIVLFIIYFKTRITLLTISYAGGCIAFDINWYSKEESDRFQKKLRIAKDKAVEDAENAAANAMREVMSNVVGTPVQPVQNVQPQAPVSTADELMKYAQLYKEGLLSEEEFAAIKAKML